MGEAVLPSTIVIRPAIPEDSGGITEIFLDSAEYHAALDPERYGIPERAMISERYRSGRQHPPDTESALTLVAELRGEIVGFVDVRLDRSPDPMHRDLVYCHIVEIAVRTASRNQGIGERLLTSAEAWGREMGAEFASLEYLASNTRVRSFYHARMGYRPAAVTAIKRL
ncbi:MAG TPA: GNAT family N-acetyltransferase [Bryobacteraceae bacterium]|nr:GNAT family N-acetyltransferase [Bryobacteraceae bacterium]